MMHVEFCGAAKVVTGSMHLVHWQGRRILLDCGLYQGRRSEAFDINRNICVDPKQVDAVVLSHAHIDHSGNLPTLVRRGFRGKIFCTDATKTLCNEMLLDSAQIQESDVRYANKIRKVNGEKPFKPLYTQPDAVNAIKQLVGNDYEVPFEVIEGVQCQFFDAGHMLGSASVQLKFMNDDGSKSCLVFSGDIGRYHQPILRNPKAPPEADFVIMEATYGDRFHKVQNDAKSELLRVCKRVHQDGGKLLVPAFSIGRTQYIVYLLNQLAEAGELPEMKVFVDSPLAIEATEAYKKHEDCFDRQYWLDKKNEEDKNPLGFRGLYQTRTAQHSKLINTLDEPLVIISASGMCEAGRILHHLKHYIEDSRNHILFAGYQAPYTLGSRILRGDKEVKIFGKKRRVKASYSRLESASGHGDQEELMRWFGEVKSAGNVKKVALVHCEEDSAESLKQKILESGVPNVMIPEKGDIMDL